MPKSSRPLKLIGLVSIIFGVIALIGGVVTWATVTSQLAAERITVPADSALVPGARVQDPISAYAQAEIINVHATKASGGKTYAELGAMISEAKAAGDTAKAEELQLTRNTLMNASFLRASLFTSVLAYGVSLLVIGLGVMFVLIGWALRSQTTPSEPGDVRPATADPATVGV